MKKSSMCEVTIGMDWVLLSFLHSMCGESLNWVSWKSQSCMTKYFIISIQAPPYFMFYAWVQNTTNKKLKHHTHILYLWEFVLPLHNMAKANCGFAEYSGSIIHNTNGAILTWHFGRSECEYISLLQVRTVTLNVHCVRFYLHFAMSKPIILIHM